MSVIAGKPEILSESPFSKIGSCRHEVFVETLGSNLKTRNGEELDQFDRPDSLYVVGQDEHGQVNGCARLLPTNRPYLLGKVFPELLNGQPIPCSPDVWELSRFAAVDFNRKTTSALSQFSSGLAIKLLQASLECAAAHGAKRLITVSPIGIERLLRRAGLHSHRAGPPTIIDGHPVFARWIELEPRMD